MAFGTLEEYKEEGEDFCLKTKITEGTLRAGPDIEMKILVPYDLERHTYLDPNSKN